MEGTTGSIVATTGVGTNPGGATYDDRNEEFVVAVSGSDDLSWIDPVGGRLVGTTAVGSDPVAVVFDNSTGNLYVANFDSNNVSVVDGLSGRVLGSIPVGTGPDALAFSSANGEIYVANYYSNTVTAIDAATGAVVVSVPVGYGPDGLAFDPANAGVYVADEGANELSVIRGATDKVTGSIPVGSGPSGLAFVPSDADVYVANSLSDNVSAVDGATDEVVGSLAVGSEPEALAFDPATHDLYVADEGSGSVSILLPGPPIRRSYPVTFEEAGLPAGTAWSVRVNATTNGSRTSTIGFSETNGTGYAYSLVLTDGAVAGYAPSPASGTFNVTGAPVATTIRFAGYPLWFNETGLPESAPGLNWSVTLTGTGVSSGEVSNRSAASSVGFRVPADYSGEFSVGSPPGWAVNRSVGAASMSTPGAPVVVTLQFVRTPSAAASFLGLPGVEGYGLLGGIGLAVFAAVVVAVCRRSRAATPPGSSVGPTTDPDRTSR